MIMDLYETIMGYICGLWEKEVDYGVKEVD